MKKVAIVYHSGYGHTKVLAEAVLEGAKSVPNIEAHIFKVEEFDKNTITKLNDFHAIIFGCPTYMGSGSAKMKQFMEDSSHLWAKREWKDKIAAGFTNSGSQNGDKLSTLIQIALFAAQHGMIWVNGADLPGNNTSKGSINDINRMGSFIGLMSQSNNDEGPDKAPIKSDIETAKGFGARIAGITKKFDN